MSTEKRIQNKEARLSAGNKILSLFETNGINGSAKQIVENEVNEIKKSLDHDRNVQKLETEKSGRRTWRDDAWKYFLVYVGGAITIKIAEMIINKI